tara:strand:+ start:227 stop:541 length:315 start_codon:yes stop_codon:yes gene_type:complete
MNWENILKRQFTSLYFQELKSELLKLVEAMPSGKKFRIVDLKEQLVNALEKPRTAENRKFNVGLTNFAKSKADRWLTSQGSRIVNNAKLVFNRRERGLHFMERI